MRADNIIFRITILLIPLLVYGVCWSRAIELPSQRTPRNSRLLARKVTPLIVINLGISIACSLFGLIASAFVIIDGANARHGWGILERGVHDFWALIFFGCYALVGGTLGFATRRLFKIRATLRAVNDDDDYSVPTKEIPPVQNPVMSFGTIVFGVVSGLFVVAVLMGVGFFALSALVFGLIPLLFWQRRRTHEGQLLWLLALSVRSNHDLAKEVTDHAATWSGPYAARLRLLAVYLQAGRPLGLALKQVPGLLPPWVVASIQIGEETGTLSETLNECATSQLHWMRERFRTGSITSLLIYLACYPFVILGSVSFMMVFIIPKYKAIFNGFGTELPRATLNLIEFSDTSLPYILVIAPLSLAGVLKLLQFDHAGWRNVRTKLFRSLYPRYDAAPIMRHLARMIEKGKTLPDSLLAIANSYHRPSIAESVASVYVDAESGGDCWKALRRQGFLSQRDLALIEAAQRVDNLPWALREIADVREKRYIFRVDTISQLLRPIPIVAVGLLAGWFCIAMFLPVVKLVNDLS